MQFFFLKAVFMIVVAIVNLLYSHVSGGVNICLCICFGLYGVIIHTLSV